jgi:GAF domain-containing protein
MDDSEARYFDALHEVARTVNSTLNASDVLSRIVKAATESTDAKGCSVMLLDDEKKHLLLSASYGLSDQYLHKGEIMADRSLADALKGESVAISNVSNDRRIQYPAEALKEGIGSMLCVPLSVRDVIIGQIRVYFTHSQDFSQNTIKLINAIANLSAIAIDNSHLHDSLRKAYDACRQELWHWQP